VSLNTADAARTYTWDLANRLTTLTTTTGTTTYAYDPGGLRTSATGPAGTTHTLWDPLHATPQVALETTGTGALVHRHLYGLGRLNHTTPDATSWNLPDTRGTLHAQISTTGTLERTWAHDPWGTIRATTNPAPDAPTNTNTYTGETTDPTGLTYLRARYYNPTLGRFLTTDPIHQPHTTPYSYTNNQPTVFVDPTGLLPTGMHPGIDKAMIDRAMIEARLGQVVKRSYTSITNQAPPTSSDPCLGPARWSPVLRDYYYPSIHNPACDAAYTTALQGIRDEQAALQQQLDQMNKGLWDRTHADLGDLGDHLTSGAFLAQLGASVLAAPVVAGVCVGTGGLGCAAALILTHVATSGVSYVVTTPQDQQSWDGFGAQLTPPWVVRVRTPLAS